LGSKNADMIDIECWMPGRGELDDNGQPTGDWGEKRIPLLDCTITSADD
jgi:hypothetical protein